MYPSGDAGELDRLLAADAGAMTAGEHADWLRQADRVRSLLEAKQLEVVGVWDANGYWALDGAHSGGSWLAHRLDMSKACANALVRDARRLRRFPATADACGSVGTSKVRALIRHVTPATEADYVEHEAMLLDVIAPLDVDQTNAAGRLWHERADTDGSEPGTAEKASELRLSKSWAGRWTPDGHFIEEDGDFLDSKLAETMEHLYRSEQASPDGVTSTTAQLRAQALLLLVRQGCAVDPDQATPAKPSITLVIDWDTLKADNPDLFKRMAGPGAEWPYRGEDARRMACDARIARIITGPGSEILDAGRSTYTVSAAQRRALRARDGGCTFPGCGRPFNWCDAHHIVHWADGGPTDMANLALLCQRHHTMIHTGFTMRRRDDGTLQFHRPDGTPIEHPRPTPNWHHADTGPPGTRNGP